MLGSTAAKLRKANRERRPPQSIMDKVGQCESLWTRPSQESIVKYSAIPHSTAWRPAVAVRKSCRQRYDGTPLSAHIEGRGWMGEKCTRKRGRSTHKENRVCWKWDGPLRARSGSFQYSLVCAVLVLGLHNVPGPMQGEIFEVRRLFFPLLASVCAIY